ncbi:MAG: hypothetical protein U9Q80_10265 [Bacillota bacterium]|nr:hypothetical protein [Bacillota bacterium]
MRRTGYHYKTIKKYLKIQDFNESHYSIRDSTSLLDPLKPIIDESLKNDLDIPREQQTTVVQENIEF